MSAPSLNDELETATRNFIVSISEALRRFEITRDQAQARVAYHITGAWNRLDPVINGLPLRIKRDTNAKEAAK